MIRRAALFLLICAVATSVFAQAANQVKQNPPINLGTSGGNIMDYSRLYCCSGTLGALVTKGGTGYILSNNHVLARSGQAAAGEDVSQPGLVDSNCSPQQIVADFSQAANLGGSNVDAAIAQVRSGMVNPTGEIIGVGIPSSTTAAPAVGRGVAKSGRTTGLTCGSISSINTNVRVSYQKGCGTGKKFTVRYSNQVVISSTTFSAGGDSGSLIVTSDTAQPIALLYAGSSSSTIGNPIGDVVKALGISFVGGGSHSVTGCGGGKARIMGGRNEAALDHAAFVKELHADKIMEDPAVQGVGVGEDENGEVVIVVYTDQGRAHGKIPDMIDGVRTKVVRTDEFRAFDWKNEDVE